MLPGLTSIAGLGRVAVTPNLRGSVGTAANGGTPSFAPTLPAHQAGDVIVVVVGYACRHDGAGVTATGWTGEAEAWTQSEPGLTIFSKTAASSSETITINNSANDDEICAHMYVLKDADGNVEATAAQTNDPPSETASWGADRNLWIAAHVGLTVASGIPSGFGDSVVTSGPPTGDTNLTTCTKADPVAALNPSAFTGSGAARTATIVVRPL